MVRWISLGIAFATWLTSMPATAQTATPVGIVTTLQGQATVAHAASSSTLPLKFKDSIFERDRINTAENSIVKVLMGGRAVVTVRELSVLTITEDLGRTTINLDSGKIAVAVAKQRMKPGEKLEVHTPNAVAAVRGTVFVVEVARQGAQAGGGNLGAATQVTSVTGSVEVTPANNPANTALLTAFKSVNLLGPTLGQVRTLSQPEMNTLLSGLAASAKVGVNQGDVAGNERKGANQAHGSRRGPPARRCHPGEQEQPQPAQHHPDGAARVATATARGQDHQWRLRDGPLPAGLEPRGHRHGAL